MLPLQVDGMGVVTALGLCRKSTSAAFRAGIDNFQESHFLDGNGEDLLVAEAPLEKPWRGKVKMQKMAIMAINEAIQEAGVDIQGEITILVCLPEKGIGIHVDEQQFFEELQEGSGLSFSINSVIIRKGKSGCVSAFQYAEELIYQQQIENIVVVATDTLLTGKLVNSYTEKRWLFTRTTSNGFIPGEAAVCLIVNKSSEVSSFTIIGIGKAEEPYSEGDEAPFLAEGMTKAVGSALNSAKQELANIKLWFSHNGTSYLSAKESTLAELKLLRGEELRYQRHSLTPYFGEVGSAAGLLMIALSYSLLPKGSINLNSMANFGSRRAAIMCEVK
ncbi:hypothetical protein [uncultured Cocleimonas sp.]|uniref:hypothetical protein n=1 Tax=uncultured Cocleimonas sp. TaxID=1051587 RepID=UPI002614B72C|nr:hypothetical protein [uncultured Cocleimonas sp.]